MGIIREWARKARTKSRGEFIHWMEAGICINAKLPIHTKSPGFGGKKG